MTKTVAAQSRPTGRWYGSTDAGTSAACVWYHPASASANVHPPQFNAVAAELERLCQTKGPDGYPLVELYYSRDDEHIRVLAYRFKSDYAYDKHYASLVELGPSLGRGKFSPWSTGSNDFEMFCATPTKP